MENGSKIFGTLNAFLNSVCKGFYTSNKKKYRKKTKKKYSTKEHCK